MALKNTSVARQPAFQIMNGTSVSQNLRWQKEPVDAQASRKTAVALHMASMDCSAAPIMNIKGVTSKSEARSTVFGCTTGRHKAQ
jgi:hypothetical protein